MTMRQLAGEVARLGPDDGHKLLSTIPERLRQMDAEFHSFDAAGTALYVVKDQSAFVQESGQPAMEHQP